MGSYGSGAMQIECKIWVKTEHYWDLYYDLMEQGKTALDQAGVRLPANNMNVRVLEVPPV